jgi:hypothetical protein
MRFACDSANTVPQRSREPGQSKARPKQAGLRIGRLLKDAGSGLQTLCIGLAANDGSWFDSQTAFGRYLSGIPR